jgi:tetratricopeptide (TPR) repeat protein
MREPFTYGKPCMVLPTSSVSHGLTVTIGRHSSWFPSIMENNNSTQLIGQSLLKQASYMESTGNTQKAIKLYRQSLKGQHKDEKAYGRLMVIFRKMKDYRNESLIIQRAIKSFEKFYTDRSIRIGKQIAGTSKAIMRALGLINKKGKPIHMLEPVERWSKRLEWVERKLEKRISSRV